MKKWITMLLTLLLLPCLSFAETVVTSFYPIWLMALNLTQGISEVNVRNLAAPTTGCLHDYQLQMADIKALSEADIFLVNGAGMENFLLKVAGDLPDLPIIEASAGIGLLGEGEAVEIGEGEESEGNSHIWLDPSRAIRMAENLADGLCELFPEYSETITANLEDYRNRLTVLDEQLRDGLRDLPRRELDGGRAPDGEVCHRAAEECRTAVSSAALLLAVLREARRIQAGESLQTAAEGTCQEMQREPGVL